MSAGRSAWAIRIRKYLSAFPDKGTPITIRHLVTHTSGIRHYLNETAMSQARYTHEQSLALFKDDPLLFTPGAFYSYSSYGVNLLQGVIEKVSGLPFEEYMTKNVWAPAEMKNTRLDIPERPVRSRAKAYEVSTGGRQVLANDLSYAYASGGMLSTAEDLVMWRIRSTTDGRRYFHHPGSVNGFNAHLAIFPGEDVVASILFNADDVGPGLSGVVALASLYLPARAAAGVR